MVVTDLLKYIDRQLDAMILKYSQRSSRKHGKMLGYFARCHNDWRYARRLPERAQQVHAMATSEEYNPGDLEWSGVRSPENRVDKTYLYRAVHSA